MVGDSLFSVNILVFDLNRESSRVENSIDKKTYTQKTKIHVNSIGVAAEQQMYLQHRERVSKQNWIIFITWNFGEFSTHVIESRS